MSVELANLLLLVAGISSLHYDETIPNVKSSWNDDVGSSVKKNANKQIDKISKIIDKCKENLEYIDTYKTSFDVNYRSYRDDINDIIHKLERI